MYVALKLLYFLWIRCLRYTTSTVAHFEINGMCSPLPHNWKYFFTFQHKKSLDLPLNDDSSDPSVTDGGNCQVRWVDSQRRVDFGARF